MTDPRREKTFETFSVAIGYVVRQN
jgi:hypothetical protein